VVVLLVVLMVIFRKNPIVKKYWKYSLLLAPLVILVILKIIMDIKNKGREATTNQRSEDLSNNIQEIRERIVDVQMESKAEIAVAKAKNDVVIKELEEVKKIPDRAERRKRLAAMIG
jgi:glucan phosphoethanolaminetransferase (alkaline phosphatase superfamily)